MFAKLEQAWRDARFGIRLHLRTPIATAAIVGTLAIGIAATAVSFSVASAFFIQPLPITDAHRFVRIYQHREGSDAQYFPTSGDALEQMRDLRQVFEDVVGEQPQPMMLGVAGAYERVWGEVVSAGYFDVLGVRPVLGRAFTPEEQRTGDTVAVLSHGLWMRRFNRDPAAEGRQIVINGRTFRVIGVAPQAFRGTVLSFTSDLWIPPAPDPGRPPGRLADGFALAKLRRGIRLEQARSALDTFARGLERESPDSYSGVRFAAFYESHGRVPPPFQSSVLGFSGLLVAAALLVTLVACTNAAGVLLARSIARRSEIGMRLALGASVRRLLAQLVAETAPLCVLAGAAGVLMAWQSMTLVSAIEVPIARGAELSLSLALDWRVLAVTAAVTALAGMLLGLIPAFEASGARPAVPRTTDVHRRVSLARTVLAIQVAISVVLLATGGLFARSLASAQQLDLGFDPTGVVRASLDISMSSYTDEEAARFWTALLEDVRQLPQTDSASLTYRLPLELGIVNTELAPADSLPPDGRAWPVVEVSEVDVGYFDTLGIPLVGGRDFDATDISTGRRVVILNDVVARQFWPEDRAIGRHVITPGGDRFEVIGMVRRSRYFSVGEEPKPYAYFPRSHMRAMTVVARGSGDSASLLRDIVSAARALDPVAPVYESGTLQDRVDLALAPTAGAAATLGALSVVTLVLTALGLFGAVAHTVGRRTYEIGVRRALGAPDAAIARSVTRDIVTAAAAGIGCGLLGAFAAGRALQALLYQAGSADPLVLATASAVLMLVCLAAVALPTLRAIRINPAAALRHE